MKKILFLSFAGVLINLAVFAQAGAKNDSNYLVMLNQQIDNAVVQRNMISLDTLYAGDFVFSHGSGKVEGKPGWLATVARANYSLRQHDSVTAEMHPGLVVVKGKMLIKKVNPDKTDTYTLRYIRIYQIRGRGWQLISHTTTYESHE